MSADRKSKSTRRSTRRRFRVLFTCSGRRVELLSAFRRAGSRLGLRLEIHACDANPLAPTMHLADKAHAAPRIEARNYISALVDLVTAEKIDLLIPLLDSELALLAESTDRFQEAGCLALISKPQVVQTCRDKLATYDALREAGIDTPKTILWTEAITRKRHKFPYFLKPRFGSASLGNHVVRTVDELHTFGLRVPDPIVQDYVQGIEHTLDVYTGLDGVPRCTVPRRRLEVRNGEVSKGLIVKESRIMDVGRSVAEMLGQCRGVITVQCIVTSRGRIRVIEINPRFGGGVPLAIYAGADFPRWILTEALGKKPRISATGFRDDVAMLRFDESVFVDRASDSGRI